MPVLSRTVRKQNKKDFNRLSGREFTEAKQRKPTDGMILQKVANREGGTNTQRISTADGKGLTQILTGTKEVGMKGKRSRSGTEVMESPSVVVHHFSRVEGWRVANRL